MDLGRWMEAHQSEGKLIIVDRLALVNSAIKRWNRGGLVVKEASVHTPLELAKQLYEGYQACKCKGREGLTYSSHTVYSLYALLDGAGDEKQYGFFLKSSLSIRTADEILRVMNIVREGKKKERVNLTDKQKGVLKLIEDYERDLEERGLIDRPALFSEAVRILEASTDEELMFYMAYMKKPSVFLDLSSMRHFSYLEKSFIDLFIEKMGLNREEGELIKIPSGAHDFNLEKAYGIYNEVNYCIKDIKEHKLPLADVGIYYTSDEYEGFLRALFESEGLGLSFDSELVSYKDVLQLILALIDSLKHDYSYEELEKVVNNPGLIQKEKDYQKNEKEKKQDEIELEEELEDLDEEEAELDLAEIKVQEIVGLENEAGPENSEEAKAWSYTLKGAYYKLLRGENIGYGKKRYLDFLKRHEELGEYSTLSPEENSKMAFFKQFLEDYIQIYEESNSPEQTLGSLIDFSRKYIRKGYEKNIILTALRDYREAMGLLGDSCKDKQLDMISDLIQGIRVAGVGVKGVPKCTKLSGRMIAETRYNYVIGLAAKYVLKQDASSPVLTDDEILGLVSEGDGYYLPLGHLKNQESNKDFDYFLESCSEGRTSLIYSDYDTTGFNALSPSLAYMNRDNGEGVSEKGEKKEGCGYDVIRTGLILPIREGKAEPREVKTEETEDKYRSLSASVLGTIIHCPLIYYYKMVENIGEIEGEKYGVWLSSSEKGTFFHKIMELYLGKVLGSDARLIAHQQSFHEEAFERAYQVALKEMEIEVPYPSDETKEKEALEIKAIALSYVQNMHDYYKREEEEARSWRVIGNELSFGPREEVRPVYSLAEEHRLEWRGSIDRMDAYVDDEGIIHLRIVDYKTGKYSNLNAKIKNNTELQHYIYAAAGLEYVRSHKEALAKAFGLAEIKGSAIAEVLYDLPFESDDKKKTIAVGNFVSNSIEITGLDYELHLPEEVLALIRPILMSAQKGDKTALLREAELYIDAKTDKEREDSCKYCNYIELCRRHIG